MGELLIQGIIVRDNFPEAGLNTLLGGRDKTVEDRFNEEYGNRGEGWDFISADTELEPVGAIVFDEQRIFSEAAKEIAHIRGRRLDDMPQPGAMSRIGRIIAITEN